MLPSQKTALQLEIGIFVGAEWEDNLYILFFFQKLHHFIVASLLKIHKQSHKVKDLVENWKNKVGRKKSVFSLRMLI